MTNPTRKDPESVLVAAEAVEAFILEVAEWGCVWTIRDAEGIPTVTSKGKMAMPFWSALVRVESVIATVSAYAGFKAIQLTWTDFRDRWIPGLERDGLRVGVNWSGPQALGYDLSPAEVLKRIQAKLAPPPPAVSESSGGA